MRIYVTSVFVDDQDKALRFYTRCQMGPAATAVLDDTCGNLIQIASHQ
jgi:catechol 2,3-dioxygenase-like lactoylglutathione lyase family enzyme